MAGLPVVYPDTLPHPEVGQFTPRERRAINREFMRPISRDRAGARSVAFTFTPAQAREFREWYQEWVTMGGGMFAASWPMPWGRGPHVFRFVEPPTWQLIGGGIDGQGYWRVTADVELRGRGEVPELEVFTVTSKPYPYFFTDAIRGAPSFKKLRFEPDFLDALDGRSAILSGDLRSIYQAYDGWEPEAIKGEYALGDGALNSIYRVYDGWEPDKIEGVYAISEGTLHSILVPYTRWTPEPLQGEYAIFGGTLT